MDVSLTWHPQKSCLKMKSISHIKRVYRISSLVARHELVLRPVPRVDVLLLDLHLRVVQVGERDPGDDDGPGHVVREVDALRDFAPAHGEHADAGRGGRGRGLAVLCRRWPGQ